MTHKYTVTKKSCPKCGRVYASNRSDMRKPLREKYGSPFVKCAKCNHIFVDKDITEISNSGVHKEDKRILNNERLCIIAFFIALGLLCFLNYDKYGFFGILFLIIAGVNFIVQFILFFPRQKIVKELTAQSENRMNDKKYVLSLIMAGYKVSDKYIDMHDLKLIEENLIEKPNETKKDSGIDIKRKISNMKPNENQHRCQECGNVQSKNIQRCLNCSNIIDDSVAEDDMLGDSSDFDKYMTGQLVAFYKTMHEDKYSKEYERRLKHIGFTPEEAKNLFMLELMMLKHDSISTLTDKKYLTNNYFDLKTVKFPMEASYYAEHQTFLISEVTKIWDEAEYIWTNYRNSEMPKEVLAEIFQISRYGGGELLIKTIEGISKSSSIPKDKILKYSNKEQDLMFKYKWNKEANEPHPYH